jgi:HK97 family phage portal protein
VRNAFLSGDGVYTGKSVNEQSAMCVSAVYYCVGLITEAIASLPIGVFRETPGGSPEAKPVPNWLVKPNFRMTLMDFWTRVMMSLLLAGNAYIYVMRDAKGNVVELWPIHPSWVYVYPDEGSNEILFDVNGVTLDQSQMLHIPALAMPGYLTGLSPLEAARQAIGVAMSAEETAARFYAQGMTLSGIVEVPGKMEPDEATRLKNDFQKRHTGASNSWAAGVLTGGASWKQITITPEQSQFLQTRNFTKADIALFYRVPAFRVDPQVTSSWGRGVEEQNYSLAQDTLYPWIVRIEQAFSGFLLPGFQKMRFNLDARLRAKLSERYQAYQLAINSGMKSPDEVRAEEGMAPIPGGSGAQFFRPVHLIGIDEDLPTTSTAKLPSLVPGGKLYEPPVESDPDAEADGPNAGGGKDPNAI